LLIASASVFAQTSQRTEAQANRQEGNLASPIQTYKTTVQDGPVDPTEYLVGPGDMFSVVLSAVPPLNFQIPVTPEGSIIIPTVGEFQIAGLTLEAAKKKVLLEIKHKYITGDPVFTLVNPRSFTVYVRGFVANEGAVTVQATERVDVVVALADDPKDKNLRTMLKDTRNEAILDQNQKGSRRRIRLQHRDGTESMADLEKFYAMHKPEHNPLLRDGDVVIVPKNEIGRNFIGVYGAVNREGQYEFVEGDDIATILRIARGLSAIADSAKIELYRTSSDESTIKKEVFDLHQLLMASSPCLLERGDRIVVGELNSLHRDDKVYVDGEVKNVGYYPITRDSTRLSVVIQMAGGFTEFASLANSQLHRRSVSEAEINTERLESARGGVTPEDSAYFYMETNIRINRELVVTDFVGLFEHLDKSKDVFLRNEDYVSIASRKWTVYVFGQVVNPGHISFKPGENYQFYVSRSGGFTEYARTGDVRIVKASTKQWLAPGETNIEPGDYVWVPKEPYRPFSFYLLTYSQVFGIVGTVVSLALLVVQTTK
jgi:protein involved in polysaccharide export with SLBB domain